MSPPIMAPGHPDRLLSIEEAFEDEYKELVARMEAAGVAEAEAGVALESLAQAHLAQIACRVDTENQIDAARAKAGLKPVAWHDRENAARAVWPYFLGGVVTTAAFVALLWLVWP